MKKAIALLGLFTVLFFVTSCESSADEMDDKIEDTDSEGNGTAGTVTAKIDGVVFTSQSDKVEANRMEFADGGKAFSITAKNEKLNKFTIIIQNYSGVENYTADNNNFNFYVKAEDKSYRANKIKEDGILTVTSDDGVTIKGTFSFKAIQKDTQAEKIITEGVFSVKPKLIQN